MKTAIQKATTLFLLAALFALVPRPATAADGSLDTGFDPNANSTVFNTTVQADGKIIIGGNFTSVGGTTRNFMARLNSDGSLDTGFDPNANGIVYSTTVQAARW